MTKKRQQLNYDEEADGDDASSIVGSHQVMMLRAQLSAYKSDESFSSYDSEHDNVSPNAE